MKCSIQDCPGTYESKMIIHAVRSGTEVLVFENVPADVCNVSSNTLPAPETIRRLEALVGNKTEPERFPPLYEYA
jgi:hypothetical protein